MGVDHEQELMFYMILFLTGSTINNICVQHKSHKEKSFIQGKNAMNLRLAAIGCFHRIYVDKNLKSVFVIHMTVHQTNDSAH